MVGKFLIYALLFCGSYVSVHAEEFADTTVSRELEEFVVECQSARRRIDNKILGVENIELDKMARVPMLFGENDIIKSISLLAGVHGEGDAAGVFSGDVNGIPGHMYRINVKRNGEEYESRSLMGSPSEIKSLGFNWIKMPYDHVAVLKVAFTDDALKHGDCYWLRIYKNGEAYKWVAITDDLSVNGVIEEVVMTSRKDLEEEDEKTALREGDVVSVTVAPISREMCDYLEAISNDSNGPRMFSGPLCLGYFLAAPLATSSITFEPEKIPYY